MMACEDVNKLLAATANNNSASPPNPPPSTPPPPLPRNAADTCFSCKRKGHWSRECPGKNPKKSHPSTPTSPSNLPLLRCPNGHGACNVRTSTNTKSKNHGKKFYCCPSGQPPDGCGFIKCCEDFVNVKSPMCPCGAGVCSLNAKSDGGLGLYRWYFACRVRKDQGGCAFYQSADDQVRSMMNGYSSPSPPPTSTMVGSSSNMPADFPVAIVSPEYEIAPRRELAMLEGNSCDPMKKPLISPRLVSQSFVCQLQTEFSRKISDAGDALSGGKRGTILEDPSTEGPNSIEGSDVRGPPPQIYQEEAQLSSFLKESSEHSNHASVASILMSFGQHLPNIPQLMSPLEHERMLKVAQATYDALQCLSIDHGPFTNEVKEYISCASRLIGIEEAMDRYISTEELIDQFYSHKVGFDSASQRHHEAVAAHKAAEDRVKSLRQELASCEAKALELQTLVADISKDLLESKKRMEAASDEMEKAMNLEQQRDLALDAAKTALEKAAEHCSVFV